jgi:hypothetical protein
MEHRLGQFSDEALAARNAAAKMGLLFYSLSSLVRPP